jgi:hypothetical protein
MSAKIFDSDDEDEVDPEEVIDDPPIDSDDKISPNVKRFLRTIITAAKEVAQEKVDNENARDKQKANLKCLYDDFEETYPYSADRTLRDFYFENYDDGKNSLFTL